MASDKKKKPSGYNKSSSPISKLFEKTPEGKYNPHLFTVVVAIGLFVFFVPLTIQLAWTMGTFHKDFITGCMDALNNLLNFPRLFDSSIDGRAYNWGSASAIWIAYLLIVLFVYIDVDRKKRVSHDSKGRAHWNDWKEHNYTRTYPLDSPEIYDAPENGDMIGNAILGQNTYLDMDRVWGMNLNMLIQGSPGSGKTRYVIKPNLLQFNSSYVVTDPSSELVSTTGKAFLHHGYAVKCINLDEMKYSDKYNPFRYIKSDEDILTLVDCLMKNTDDSEASKGDQFFAKAEQCLFLSLFYYIYYEMPPEEQNLNTVMKLYREAKASEGNEKFKSKLDLRFEKLENEKPNHIAVANYHTFQQGTGKTLKSILISFGVRMNPFNVPALQNLVSGDTVHLEELGDRKQILYIIAPTEKKTYNFIAAMMYTQLFQTLYKRSKDNKTRWMLKKGPITTLRSDVWANSSQKKKFRMQLEDERDRYLKAVEEDDDPNDEKFKTENEQGIIPVPKYRLKDADTGEILQEFQSKEERDLYMDCIKNGTFQSSKDERLPCNVRCMLDEFANTCEIPGFDNILNTCRKYDISCTIIIQSMGQLKKMYKDDYSAIVDGCSTQMYLAIQEAEDLKRVSDLLGSKTVDTEGTSRNFGSKGSSSESINHDAESLMTVSEIRSMPAKKCIIFISGEAPFYDDKYALEKHKNYHEIDTDNPDNFLDYKQYFYIEDRAQIKENEELEMTVAATVDDEKLKKAPAVSSKVFTPQEFVNGINDTSGDTGNAGGHIDLDLTVAQSVIKALNSKKAESQQMQEQLSKAMDTFVE